MSTIPSCDGHVTAVSHERRQIALPWLSQWTRWLSAVMQTQMQVQTGLETGNQLVAMKNRAEKGLPSGCKAL